MNSDGQSASLRLLCPHDGKRVLVLAHRRELILWTSWGLLMAGVNVVIGTPFMLELPDGRSGKVVVQNVKRGKGGVTLALLGEDLAPF